MKLDFINQPFPFEKYEKRMLYFNILLLTPRFQLSIKIRKAKEGNNYFSHIFTIQMWTLKKDVYGFNFNLIHSTEERYDDAEAIFPDVLGIERTYECL